MSDLATEFGDTGQYNLSSYYKGGGLVPDTGTNTNVPSSGQIKLSNFYSASATTVTVSLPADFTQTIFNQFAPPPEETTILNVSFQTDGDIFTQGFNFDTGTTGDKGDWLSDISGLPGDAANYEIFATLTSEGFIGVGGGGIGGTTTGTFGSWLGLGSVRTWGASAEAGDDDTWESVIQFQVREIANTANTDTINITLRVNFVNTL